MQFVNLDFTKRLSYGGGGGGGGGNAFADDPYPGGDGGDGGGLVYLLLDALTLDGRIESEGILHEIYEFLLFNVSVIFFSKWNVQLTNMQVRSISLDP